MKIVFTGGGSGGHIFPLIALTHALRELQKATPLKEGIACIYIGPDTFGKDALLKAGIEVRGITTGKLRRYLTIAQIVEACKFILGFFQSLWHVWWVMPDLIFSKGGYGSFWVVAWGWLFRVPIVIHESDAIPGLANRLVERFAKMVLLAFKEGEPYFINDNIRVVGNPIREELFEDLRENPRTYLGITTEKPVLLILGGSQGAERINNTILEILPDLAGLYEVLHQCGTLHFTDIKKEVSVILGKTAHPSYHLFPFLNEKGMNAAYRAADLIVSRSGAGSVFEIAASGKPAILIPLASSSANHQRENALIYSERGAALLLEEPNLTPHLLITQINQLMQDENRRKKMWEATRQFAKPNAAALIAKELIKLVNQES